MKHTLTDGPLAGKTFLVPPGVDEIPTRGDSGRYRLADGAFEWCPVAPVIDFDVNATAFEAALADTMVGESSALAQAVAQAWAGRRVMLVAPTRKEATQVFRDEVVDLAGKFGDVARLNRSNGSERIRFESGGLIVAVGLNSTGGRGIAVDVLALINLHETSDQLAPLLPVLATSKVGSIVVVSPPRVEADPEAAE